MAMGLWYTLHLTLVLIASIAAVYSVSGLPMASRAWNHHSGLQLFLGESFQQ